MSVQHPCLDNWRGQIPSGALTGCSEPSETRTHLQVMARLDLILKQLVHILMANYSGELHRKILLICQDIVHTASNSRILTVKHVLLIKAFQQKTGNM